VDARFITVGVTISFDYPLPHPESVASEEARNSSYESHAYRVGSPRPQFCDLVLTIVFRLSSSAWLRPAQWIRSPVYAP